MQNADTQIANHPDELGDNLHDHPGINIGAFTDNTAMAPYSVLHPWIAA
jgi:hypothetical protein